jgi:hypothetical protein
MKKKSKRLTLAKETVSLLENANVRGLVDAATANTCAFVVGDAGSWPGRCFLVQCG